MKQVIAYQSGIPSKNTNLEKTLILTNFIKGVIKLGDQGIDHNGGYIPSDVAILQGWIKEGEPQTSKHLLLRQQVINEQRKINKSVICADSNLFLYSNTANPLHYLRYSINGVFPNTGEYCDNSPDPYRWKTISQDLNIQLKDYRSNGNHILLCLQRNGGWSMGQYDVQDWAIQTITELRKYTDRPIVLRGHPGDKAAKDYLDPSSAKCRIKGFSNVSFSDFKKTLMDDLQGAWAVINHNSSPSVGAAIEGYPIFLTDPVRSQCREIGNTDLSTIEHPNLPDRQSWVERISMFHWNFSDLESGRCWAHMRKYV
jgi:hypothetical protein